MKNDLGQQTHGQFRFEYTQKKPLAFVYGCSMHLACPFRLKLHRGSNITEAIPDWIFSQSGTHGDIPLKSSRGISPAMKGEVDSLISAGLPPGRIVKEITKLFPDLVVPKRSQINNRRAAIQRNPVEGWAVSTQGQMDAWIDSRFVDTEELYHKQQNPSACMVIGKFEGGFVFSTKKLLGCLIEMVGAQGRYGGAVNGDCTFKIIAGGDVLGMLAVNSVVRASDNKIEYRGNENFKNSATPLVLAVAKVESSVIFQCMMAALHWVLRDVLKVPAHMLQITRGGIDCSFAVANGMLIQLSQVAETSQSQVLTSRSGVVKPVEEGMLLNCWPHFKRNFNHKGMTLLKNKELFKLFAKQLDDTRAAPTAAAFAILASEMTTCWLDLGEEPIATWVTKVYLNKTMMNWWAHAAKILGVFPDQNPLESLNKQVKSLSVLDHLYSSMTVFVNRGLPSILEYCERILAERNMPLVRDIW